MLTSFLFQAYYLTPQVVTMTENKPLQRQVMQQMPVDSCKDHDAILNSTYLTDIADALQKWDCKRAVLVHSKALDNNTSVIKDLKSKLGPSIRAAKNGVGAHSPYEDVIEITKMLNETQADCLICIGSSSYSDAAKIARLMHTNLPSSDLTPTAMESLVDKDLGNAKGLKDPKVRLILVPTSLSASEWNHVSSATNPLTHKKQHFENEHGHPDLILLDPEVASTSPRTLWLSSGVRAVDHCVESMCNKTCTAEQSEHNQDALRMLLRGLKEYKDGQHNENREVLLKGVSDCQLGSQRAMMGLLIWGSTLGPSHAIGHQCAQLPYPNFVRDIH
jgi:alcohol dehydrogenase class IV